MSDDMVKKIDTNQEIINRHRPFEGPLLDRTKEFYRVGCVYTSNVIEGFTYTESETNILLYDGLTAGGKPLRDMYAVLGHAKAYDHMYTLLKNREVTEDDIKKFHSMLEGSLGNDALTGEYRAFQVFIRGSEYPVTVAEDVPQEMQDLMQAGQEKRNNFHPVEFAAWLHMKIAFIHPFGDGNGRVARLSMNTCLIQEGFLPTVIPPILRSEYMGHLEKGRINDRPFYEFIFRCENETQKEMIKLLEPKQKEKLK